MDTIPEAQGEDKYRVPKPPKDNSGLVLRLILLGALGLGVAIWWFTRS